MSNRVYDILKFVAQILLPAVGTLYFALAGYWDFPNPEGVVGTIVAVDTFLGVVLGLSTQAYNNSDAKYDGAFEVREVEGTKQVTLNFQEHPAVLETKNEVLLKVDPQGRTEL